VSSLTPARRAKLIARRKPTNQATHPETKQDGPRQKKGS